MSKKKAWASKRTRPQKPTRKPGEKGHHQKDGQDDGRGENQPTEGKAGQQRGGKPTTKTEPGHHRQDTNAETHGAQAEQPNHNHKPKHEKKKPQDTARSPATTNDQQRAGQTAEGTPAPPPHAPERKAEA